MNGKQWGLVRSNSQVNWGRQALELCGLEDLGFEGYPFTWSNGIREDNNIRCRLDITLAYVVGFNRFYPIQVTYLPRFGLDHVVLIIELEKNHDGGKNK